MAPLDTTFGMLFIGLVITTCLYGITLIQAYNYFRGYSRDPALLKATVALVILLDTAGTACAAQGMYWYLITHYGDPTALAIIDKALCVESLLTVLVTFIVQCFFAHSVWKVSRRNWMVTGIICVTAFAALVVGIAMSIEDLIQGFFAKLGAKRFWVLAGLDLGIAAICDLTITGSLCYYFHLHKGGFRRTDTLLDKLIVYTINRGVVTFIVQTLNMAFFIGMPDNLVWGPFHLVLSKVYTIALLATLNRRDISDDGVLNSDSMQYKSGTTNIGSFRAEISTQVDTIRMHDVSVEFPKSKGSVGETSLGSKKDLNV